MADKWKTQVGQLRLVDGSRQQDPANLGVAERRSFLPVSRRGKGRLYVLMELSGSRFGREELCQDLVRAIIEEYFHTPGTVTYGLRQAVLLANTMLVRANARVANEHRIGGVTCVALRGGEMFVAQAGWPMVCLVREDQVQAFPDTTLIDQDTSMLGQRQTTEVRLFHSAIRPGDTILMVDGPMSRKLGVANARQVIVGRFEQAMRNLETLAPPEDCTAMLIRVGGTPPSAQAERWAFVPVEKPEDEIARRGGPPRPPAPSPSRESVLPPAPVDGSHAAEWDAEAEEPEAYPPQVHAAGPTVGKRVQTFLQGVGKGISALGERMLPDKQHERASTLRAQRRRRASRARRRHGQVTQETRWWAAVAIAVPILVLISVGGYTAYRNWSQQSLFEEKLEMAQRKRDIALSSAESPTVARDYWLEVLALVNEADVLQPDNQQTSQLRAQAEAEMDRIDGVTRLGQAYKIYEYTVAASAPSRVIVAGLDVYVLDRGAGRIYRHALNDLRNALRNPNADQVLIRQGQPIEGHNIGGLIDVAWMKEGGERQAGALLILDTNGVLLEYDPTWEQFQAQIVGGQGAWRSPYALGTYDSNLYLLDPMANQIFKYQNQQFANEPTRWITQDDVNVTTAIDIGIDGSIYLLHKDAQITKYYGGKPVSFVLTRIPRPLSSADALYLDVKEVAQYIYVADSSEECVVQLDHEGTFVRQLKPARGHEATFRQLAGIFVDEMSGKMYTVAANALYVTDIPPMQR
jgi:hypothetical protein